MEGCSSNLTNEDKAQFEIQQASKLDNDKNRQNNNEDGEIKSSINIPVQNCKRNEPFVNRVKEKHRGSPFNFAFVENIHFPHPSQIPIRKNTRRHSINIEDYSFNHHHSTERFTSDNTASSQNSKNYAELQSPLSASNDVYSKKRPEAINSTPLQNWKQTKVSNENTEVSSKDDPNDSVLKLKRAQTTEKVKDKSFIRKSSLNRLEFVQPLHQAADFKFSSPKFQSNELPSTSDANSDNNKCNMSSVSSTASKKSYYNATSNDSKDSRNSLTQKLKHKRALYFKKKSHSAGEQDTATDTSDCSSRKSKFCFSSQEIDYQKDKPRKKSFFELRKKHLSLDKANVESMISKKGTVHKSVSEDSTNSCDISSHCNSKNNASFKEAVSVNIFSLKPEKDGNAWLTSNCNSANYCNGTPGLDQDLFTFQNSPTHKVFSNPFPTEELESSVTHSLQPNINQKQEQNAECSSFNDKVECVTDKISSLEVVDPVDLPLSETEVEYAKLPSSILRNKYLDRKEIHGILKHTGDDKLSRNLPSILKHRESSSEEKDMCSQTDLHSILKKSASEDESYNNSNNDIRPILKNTSTDDESPTSASRPKPILKKRTSFSEECSYAWFHGVDLKPILKKTTISEESDAYPKPILKTRRKSEEATATTTEFATSSRPRAYSADRGVRRKVYDANLT